MLQEGLINGVLGTLRVRICWRDQKTPLFSKIWLLRTSPFPYFYSRTNGRPIIGWKADLISWPPHIPDLTTCDYFLRGHLKDMVNHGPPNTISDLINKITQAIASIDEGTSNEVSEPMKTRLFFELRVGCGHFKRTLNWEQIPSLLGEFINENSKRLETFRNIDFNFRRF